MNHIDEETLHRLELESMETFGDVCRLFIKDDLTNLDVIEALLNLTEKYPHLQDSGSMEEVFSKMFEILRVQPFRQVTRKKEKRQNSPAHCSRNRSQSEPNLSGKMFPPKRGTFSILQSFAVSGKASSDMNCSICFDPLSSDKNKLTMLDCYHEFHTHCLNQWLKKSRTCPICRGLALLFHNFPNLALDV